MKRTLEGKMMNHIPKLHGNTSKAVVRTIFALILACTLALPSAALAFGADSATKVAAESVGVAAIASDEAQDAQTSAPNLASPEVGVSNEDTSADPEGSAGGQANAQQPNAGADTNTDVDTGVTDDKETIGSEKSEEDSAKDAQQGEGEGAAADTDSGVAPVAAGDVCQIIDSRGTFVGAYPTLQEAFDVAPDGSRIELLTNLNLDAVFSWAGRGATTLTAAPAVQSVSGAASWQGSSVSGETPQAVLMRTKPDAGLFVGDGSSLLLENIVLDGGSKQPTPISTTSASLVFVTGAGSSLTLSQGCVLRNANMVSKTPETYDLPPAAGVTVDDNAELVIGMAVIEACDSQVRDNSSYTRSGGSAIGLREGAKFTMFSGKIQSCYNAGAGGAIKVVGDNVSMLLTGNATIQNNVSNSFGGAISAQETPNSVFEIDGKVSIKGNQAEVSGGAFYVGRSKSLSIGGGAVIEGNKSFNTSAIQYYAYEDSLGMTLRDVTITGNIGNTAVEFYDSTTSGAPVTMSGSPYIYANEPWTPSRSVINLRINLGSSQTPKNTGRIYIDKPLDASAKIEIYHDTCRDEGAQFGTYEVGCDANLDSFEQTSERTMVGHDGGSGKLVWARVNYQILRPDGSGGESYLKSYVSLADTFAAVQDGDRIEALRNVEMEQATYAPADGGSVTLCTAPSTQPVDEAFAWLGDSVPSGKSPQAVITRTDQAAEIAVTSGELSLVNLVIDGGSTNTTPVVSAATSLCSVSGAGTSLVLGSGAVLRNASVDTRASSSSVAPPSGIRVADQASLIMLEGSLISGCSNMSYIGDSMLNRSNGTVGVYANSLVDMRGGTIENCYTNGQGAAIRSRGKECSIKLSGNAIIQNNEALDNGGAIDSQYIGSTLTIDGPVVIQNNKAGSNAAIRLYETGSVYIGGGATFKGNVSTGGASVIGFSATSKNTGGLTFGDVTITGNTCARSGNGAVQFLDNSNQGFDLAFSGTPYIFDNSSEGYSKQVNVFVERANGAATAKANGSIRVIGTLGDAAKIGVTDAKLKNDGDQFGVYVDGNNTNLDKFVNDTNNDMVGADGGAGKVIWKSPLEDVSFTKVGAQDSAGHYTKLAGSEFTVYKYAGSIDINQGTSDAGFIALASLSATTWQPLLDADGTVGVAGDTSNVPYVFVSGSDGTVTVSGLQRNSWYALVETKAPAGYQVPTGQWFFKATDPDGDKVFSIDTANVIARRGQERSLPPAMATSIETTGGTETGVFVVNVPTYSLPNAGVPVQLPVGMIAGGVLVVLALLIHRMRSRHSRKLA